ncbi:serine hydrolase domain-containing protein [Flavobacterium sp.]|uniref:serine hydrolase domain-containing protein n=1 Tax=Flavobacterium sp. TaxID=239 RepID=UPI00261D21C3|nr:serine hydrolase domain-containing protein [Flavobacterium sp.]MDD2984761.1 serine hydrolase [Flavobacterium sp.]
MLIKTIYILYFLLLLLKLDCCHSQSEISKINNKTQKIIEKYLVKENIPGMSITVTLNDSVIFSKGFGFSDIENKKPVYPNSTKFRIASITKTITASTIARLSELNIIDLKKSVYHYLDSLPRKQFDFTIEEVGGHLSGIRRVPSGEKYTCDNQYQKSNFYSIFNTDNLLFEPSTSYEYSNYGYKLLGVIIEKQTQESIFDNHKKYILNVLGLENTVPETKIHDSLTSKFYIEKKGEIIEAPCLDCTFKYAQGCYLSTSEDLAKLGNAYLFPNRILKKETLVELIRSKKLKNGIKTNYGFGFMSGKDFYGNLFFGHNGAYQGSRSVLRIYPKSKIVIAILANRNVDGLDNLATEISYNYNKISIH